jgi:hypothetical protein
VAAFGSDVCCAHPGLDRAEGMLDRMIRRPASGFRVDPAEAKLGQIKLIDKDVNNLNRIVLVDPVFQAFG